MPVTFFLMSFLRVDADDFAAGIEERAAAVARVDGRVGLNPGSGTGVGKFSDGTNDALRDAEEHGVAGIADGQDAFPLADVGRGSKSKMREFVFSRRLFHFCQSNVQFRVNIDDFGFKLLAIRKLR